MTEQEEFEFRLRLERERGESPAKPAKPELQQRMENIVGGAIRGAGSIGSTLLELARTGPQGLGGASVQSLPARASARGDAITGGLRELGANPDSLAFGAGKLGTEVAGTLGAGGALSRAVPAALPALRQAVASSGMSAGGAGMGTRVAGGALTGAAAAGLVDPASAPVGAAVGGALPPVASAVGRAGSAVGRVFRGQEAKAGDDLAQALELLTPAQRQAVADQLRAAQTLVPGSMPTVAQVLRTPQAGIVQRVVGDSAGGSPLRDRLAAQNTARLGALERVAPVNPLGRATAMQETGDAIARTAKAGDAAARARTSALFDEVPFDEASMYLPVDQFAETQAKYFGRGSFGNGGEVNKAVQVAREIGTMQTAPGRPVTMPASAQPKSLAQAVRQAGGLSIANHSGMRGELAGMRENLKNIVRTNGGRSPAEMAERMFEAGYLPDQDISTLLGALSDEAAGRASFSVSDDLERMWAAQRDAGDVAGEAVRPIKVTLREVQNLRRSIGDAQRAAAGPGGNASEASALSEMKRLIDDRINEVARGDGAADEVLPVEWANSLSAALKSKADQVARFRTGAQADIFRTGADGTPVAEGKRLAEKFWRSPEDVKDFKRLVGDNPQLLGQFRGMVATEGAGTQTAGGQLTSKFVNWVEGTLPRLKETFEPAQVRTLQRIAADIKRAEAAAAAGMSRGSNTYQNAQNALSLGLLDSPLMNAAANRIPVVNQLTGPVLDWAREGARKTKATRLANLLADPEAAANALNPALGIPPNPLLAPYLYRAAPALAADR